ncbi:MAG TPA: type II toxin-antitoxin system HipA family toxin [Verrucomicrobiae bacterium]|jgi:serine/threonine-protein kinase HipA|nr:type II toxin-antitoxin system HipA family toxin [Verrucomicrobiae bacterium]
MPRTLDVYLRRQLVGQLIQDEHGQMAFYYAESWLNNAEAIPLSHSLPLRKGRFNRNECRGFFAGVLPDESKREIIAKNLGISARNDFAMLEQIGGECAGAVTFIPTGENLPDLNYNYRELTGDKLAEILRLLPRRPLMAGEDGIRLSLAGAQDKIAVHVSNNQISIPLGGAPSTHILKPAIERFEGIVFNEFFCMKLAHAIGLYTAKAEVGKVENIDYLLVERYDRTILKNPNGTESLEREHQEDFCQALGIIPDNKYQNEGGPSLKQCFALLRELSSAPVIDLQRLLDAVIFNFLIGNHDAHGKNFSLLYGSETRLAPLYDVLSTAYYPDLAKKMAMKIGGEYISDKVLPKDFDQLADEAGLAKPMVKRRVRELAATALSKMPDMIMNHPTTKAVAALVESRCTKTLEKFKE